MTIRTDTGALLLSACLALGATATDARPSPDTRCLLASGNAAASCVKQYARAVGACRNQADLPCEAALRTEGGRLAGLLAATEEPTRTACSTESANKLTFLRGLDDLVFRTSQACGTWAEDFLALAYAEDLSLLSPTARLCQRSVARQLGLLRDAVMRRFGRKCYAAEFAGNTCDRPRRDAAVARAQAAAHARIVESCGATFDQLGLAVGTTLDERVDALLTEVVTRARHLAQRIYPPLNLGPTGLFGSAPVGVRTFNLVDPSRLNVAGTGPRPLRVDVYYPSTPEAVAGVGRDAPALNFVTPTYRDVARAAGSFPLVLFSPGLFGAPSAYVYLAAHLASHGILVVGISHHGDSSPNITIDRPLDLSVLLDQLLALNGEPGSFFENAIDPARIGAAGHSLGGYTVTALATCPFPDGTFDARVRAILPLEGSPQFFSTRAPGIFSTIAVPSLMIGASFSRLAPLLQAAFDALTPGPEVMAYANLSAALHNTFTDGCEIGAFVAECGPTALPWRYARHVTNYLALNFFAATLNGDPDALARLDPSRMARIDEMTVQRKGDACVPGDACGATCTLPCGDGIVGPREVCDAPGEQDVCAPGATCNDNCTACVECADATVIGPDGGVIDGTTVGGTAALASSCGNDVFAPERIFRWTPGTSHVATIQTCGGTTNYRTTLYVREGTCLGPDLACNQRGCGEQSRITMPVVAGTTYYIVVDGFLADAGDFTLTVD